jgi:hypothetical protein
LPELNFQNSPDKSYYEFAKAMYMEVGQKRREFWDLYSSIYGIQESLSSSLRVALERNPHLLQRKLW